MLVFREGLEAVLILAAHHRLVRRRRAAAPRTSGLDRRGARPARLDRHLGARADAAALAPAVRREARGGRRAHRDRGAAADHQLVLPQGLLERVDRRFPPPAQALEKPTSSASSPAQALGLGLLGLTSVYREGFETVLFLQSLQLERRHDDGAGGRRPRPAARRSPSRVVTFALQRKLPYKKMLVVTGVMIGFVLVVMVGQTARMMQGTGWLPITPSTSSPRTGWASGSASSRRGRRSARRSPPPFRDRLLRARAGGPRQAPTAPPAPPRRLRLPAQEARRVRAVVHSVSGTRRGPGPRAGFFAPARRRRRGAPGGAAGA